MHDKDSKDNKDDKDNTVCTDQTCRSPASRC